MRFLFHHILRLLFANLLQHVDHASGYVARLAPKTYRAYDADATGTLDAYKAKITPNLTPRQLMDPDSQMAQYFNSRPTSYPSKAYTPVTINSTEDCVLWDPTCHGDRNAALIDFFNNTQSQLINDPCFTVGKEYDISCTENKPGPSLVNYWSTVRSWMREPACQTARDEAHQLLSRIQPLDIYTNCCGDCGVGGPNVDVYYWESPNPNTDCLSIIGTEVAPPLEGASTIGTMTYWGVTTVDTDEFNSILTTMLYTSVNGINFKMPLVNPWTSVTQTNGVSQGPNTGGRQTAPTGLVIATTTPAHAAPVSSSPAPTLKVRAAHGIPHGRIQPRNPTNDSYGYLPGNGSTPTNNSAVSTVVVNGHTLTSPSIYVDFYSLSAYDECGPLGASVTYTSTMLAFAPGELSTYNVPLTSVLGANPAPKAVPYNFNDLPCPPQSVMYDQWYKPEPGQPYRPIISMPSKVLGIDPAWKGCTANWFTGFDPPRPLAPATAMAPSVAPAASPVASPVPDTNGQGQSPAPSPAPSPEPQPQPTPQPAASPVQQANDPNNESPSQMAQIDKALAPAPSPQNDVKANIPAANPPAANPPAANPPAANPPAANPPTVNPPANNVPANTGSDNSKQVVNPQPVNNSPVAPANSPQAPQTIASVGGQPIVAVPQQPSSGGTGQTGLTVNNSPAANNNPAINQDPAKNQNSPAQGTNNNPGNTGNTPPQVYQVGNIGITQGGAPVTVSGTPVVAPSSGGLVVGDKTYPAPAPVAAPTTANIAGHSVVAGPSGYNVDGVSVTPGGPPVTAGGQVVNVDSNNSLHVGGSVFPITSGPATGQPTSIAGQVITPVGSGTAVIDGQTLTQGAPVKMISGTPVSLGPSNSIVVSGSSYQLSAAPTAAPTTIDGQKVVPLAKGGGVSIGGTTLIPGGAPATISGTAVSLDPSGSIHFGGSSYALPPAPTGGSAATPTTIGGEAVVPLSNGAISVEGKTLTPGAPAITGQNGQLISLGPSGLVVGSSTVPLSALTNSATPTTIGGETVVPLSNGGVSVEGHTLTPGAPAITGKDGEIISLGTSGLVVGSTTVPLSALTTPNSGLTATIVDGQTIAPVSNGVSVDGTTLTPGQAVTGTDGVVVSLGPSGLVVVSSGVSTTIPVTTGPAGGYTLGGSITPGSGTGPGGPSQTSFKGSAERRVVDWSLLVSIVGMAGLVMMR